MEQEGEILGTHARLEISADISGGQDFLGHFPAQRRLRRRVDGRRIASLEGQSDGHAVGRCDAVADPPHAGFHHHLLRRTEAADGAAEHGLFRQDIVRMAGMEARHREHRRLQRLGVAADQGLQRLDQRGAGDHGVGRLVRHRGMPAASRDGDLETIRTGHHRSLDQRHLSGGKAGPVMQAEYRLHRKSFEQALLDHDSGTALMLLGRLKDEIDAAVEIVEFGGRNQRLGGTQEHRRVAVVAAGVHASGMTGAMAENVELIQRQGVHVGAQADGAIAAAALQPADDTGAGQTAVHFQPQALQMRRHDVGGAPLAECQFGMAVEIAANGRDPGH